MRTPNYVKLVDSFGTIAGKVKHFIEDGDFVSITIATKNEDAKRVRILKENINEKGIVRVHHGNYVMEGVLV